MKKKLLLLILFIGFITFPISISAETKKYSSLNFKETLADDDIEETFKEYNPNDDAITIYMFRGKGCGYCHAFLEFMDSITEEYGKYFKMVSFEVWNDSKNSKLMNNVSDFLGEPAGGVPYIIIGDKVFGGYTTEYDEAIKEAIVNEYNRSNKERYNLLEEYSKSGNTVVKTNDTKIIIWNLIFGVAATCFIIANQNSNYKKLSEEIKNSKRIRSKK